MHINALRDIPLALGIVAILIGVTRGSSICSSSVSPDGENPQWLCGAVLDFVGVVLVGFAILGHFSPR